MDVVITDASVTDGQKCRVGYLARRIAHDFFEAANYIDCTAVAIELLKDSKEETKRRTNMQGNGVALYTLLDVRIKIEDPVKEEIYNSTAV